MFKGDRNLLASVAKFVDEAGPLDAGGSLLVWRTLSRANWKLADGAAALPSVADHVVLRSTLSQHVREKIVFIVTTLGVSVRKVTIRGRVRDQGSLSVLLQRCPQLQGVRFKGCHRLTDAVAEQFAQCPQLRDVNFQGCLFLTDAAVQHLAQCPQLLDFNFRGCHRLTDAAAQHLAQCPQLRDVNFRGCHRLTDAAAQHLAQCPLLQHVYCRGCMAMTDAAAEHLAPGVLSTE